MNDEATDGDEDAEVGHVEGRERMREWNVQIEERENENERNTGQDDEEPVVVLKGTERPAVR